jgi:hypothetical protein
MSKNMESIQGGSHRGGVAGLTPSPLQYLFMSNYMYENF